MIPQVAVEVRSACIEPYTKIIPWCEKLRSHPDEAVCQEIIKKRKALHQNCEPPSSEARLLYSMCDLMLENYAYLENTRSGCDAPYPGGESITHQNCRLETGFCEFDRIVGGLKRGGLTVLAGERGCGLTSLALNMVVHHTLIARDGAEIGYVVMITNDLLPRQLSMRLLSLLSGIELRRMQAGYLGGGEWDALDVASGILAESDIYISYKKELVAQNIRSACLEIKKKYHHLDLVVIDDLNLMSSPANPDEYEQRLGEEVQNLSVLAGELGVPILALAEIGQKADFQDGSNFCDVSNVLYQNAHEVLKLYRCGRYAELSTIKPLSHFTAKASLLFRDDTLKFDAYP